MDETYRAESDQLILMNFRDKTMPKEHRVGVVLDEDFGQRLKPLAQRLHVWIVESPANNSIAASLQEPDTLDAGDPLESGITTFKIQATNLLSAIMEDVDEHHGEHAHSPPWTVLEIYGLTDDAETRKTLSEYGVTQIKRTKHGIEARRVL